MKDLQNANPRESTRIKAASGSADVPVGPAPQGARCRLTHIVFARESTRINANEEAFSNPQAWRGWR
ncbi:MAG: hypothetical protein ACKOLA_01490, partial [Spartobacteria bacterium]